MQRCDTCLDLLDEDDEEWRTPAQWLFDMVALPAVMIAFTALCVLIASALILACTIIWRIILTV